MFTDVADAAARCVRVATEPVLPRDELRSVYAEGYAQYRRLFDGVEGALA
jgi:hypothetical protein